jgi:SulP family sulfate permease
MKGFFKNLGREFTGYGPAALKRDVLAGITVMAVALPLALAFGISSGATAQAGLVTAIVAGVVMGGLSGASFQISGPTGAMAAILGGLAVRYGQEGLLLAGAMSGAVLIFAGVLRLGKLVRILPSPVVTGFTSGIGVIIFIGQLDNFLGVATPATESAALKLVQYVTGPPAPQWQAMALGGLVATLMILWPRAWQAAVPSSLAGLVAAGLLAGLAGWDVAVIGEIPASLPSARLTLGAINPRLLGELLPPALSVAMLGMIESLLCAEVGARMKGEAADANQEIIAQGVGNLVIPFFGGVPATAAIARTSVAIKAGGQTRLVSLFHSLFLLGSMFLLGPVVSRVPLAALAGVLMVTAWRMNEWQAIHFIFSGKHKGAMAQFFVTMAATAIFDLTQAILIGALLACALFIRQVAVEMEISALPVDEAVLQEKHGFTPRKPLDFIRVIYLSGPLFFGTARGLGTAWDALPPHARVLILSMRGVPLVDTSGLIELCALLEKTQARGGALLLCGLQGKVRARLEEAGFLARVGPGRVFWSAEQAIAHAQDI